MYVHAKFVVFRKMILLTNRASLLIGYLPHTLAFEDDITPMHSEAEN